MLIITLIMRRICTAVVVAGVALALATPGTAQAPTLDQRVQNLEDEVQSLEWRVRTLEESYSRLNEYLSQDWERTNAIESENVLQRIEIEHLQIKVDALEKRRDCATDQIAVSMRHNRDVFVTRRDAQRKVYLQIVDRSCLAGVRDDYRFSGFRGRP